VKLGLDPAQPQISIVGALAGHKGHRCFLQAARLVLLSQPGARFNIVGDETGRTHGYRDELRVLAEQLGVSAAVKFWGFVDDVVARDLMAASDVLIAASREEGFGMTLAEAQACETPVVASRIQPFDEVIVDGRSGHLVELDNAAEFARRTLELINDEARRRQMGKAGREWVRSRFGIASYVEQMNEDYDQLLGARDAMAS
jgi:glycosyltransferase involved in cell wall biosynthesis